MLKLSKMDVDTSIAWAFVSLKDAKHNPGRRGRTLGLNYLMEHSASSSPTSTHELFGGNLLLKRALLFSPFGINREEKMRGSLPGFRCLLKDTCSSGRRAESSAPRSKTLSMAMLGLSHLILTLLILVLDFGFRSPAVFGMSISTVSQSCKKLQMHLAFEDELNQKIGNFVLKSETDQFGCKRLAIYPLDAEGHVIASRVLFASPWGGAFLQAARGETQTLWKRGGAVFKDRLLEESSYQLIDRISVAPGGGIQLGGQISFVDARLPFEVAFEVVSPKTLRMSATIHGGEFNRILINLASKRDEKIFGFGSQMTRLDMKGRKLLVLSQEQGHGRGRFPLSPVGDWVVPQAVGDWSTTYASIPYFMTDSGRGLVSETNEHAYFDMVNLERIRLQQEGKQISVRLMCDDSPLGIIEELTTYTGRMPPLPAWTQMGVVLSAQGGQGAAEIALSKGLSSRVPVAGLWLQDWVGVRIGMIWERLVWNWQLDSHRYPDWTGLVRRVKEKGVEVLSYINPRLSPLSPDQIRSGTRNLFAEAEEQGFLVRDSQGQPYLIGSGGFSGALVDLNNEAAVAWYKDIMRIELVDRGVCGWMADFGEELPYDAELDQGVHGASYHHRYIEKWSQINREVIDSSELRGKGFAFVRAGFTRSPRWAQLFWVGDQLSSWDGSDGMASALTGMLTSGISGMALTHSDTGGMISIVPLGIVRSKELFKRWFELNAFTVLLRLHPGTNPRANHQFDSDQDTLSHVAKFSRLFRALAPYRLQLMEEASERGWPVLRHPFLVDSKNIDHLRRHDSFLLGNDVFVAPTLERGSIVRKFILPTGRWIHLWSGKEFQGNSSGQVGAPIGQPAVFYRQGSWAGDLLREFLVQESKL